MIRIKAVVDIGDYSEYEVRYKDPVYEVYSFSLGDGLWGKTFDDEDELVEYLKRIGQYDEGKVKALFDELEEFEIEIPETAIRDTIMRKDGKTVSYGADDLEAMMTDSVITMPDGSQLEPDAEGSPLRAMGLI